jgi:hypothetical protein
MQPFGGAADVFFLGDYNEVAQLADVDHVRPIGTQVLQIMSWTVSVPQSRICSTVTQTQNLSRKNP